MDKHTPGPWGYAEAPHDRANDYGCEYLIERVVDGKPNGEFFIEVLPVKHGKAEANARLIAAAPDMLELLRSMVAVLEDYDAEATSDPFATKEFFENLAEEFLVDAHEILRGVGGETK